MTSAAAPNRGLPPIAIITLASLTAVGPLAIDMYLAALPAIAVDLGTTTAYAQLTLTAFMVGMGTGQFIVGPLSDKTGRRLPLLIGVTLCALSALVCVFAPTVELFIAARFVMGFTGSIGMVLARAIVADSTSGLQTARLMGIMMMINGIAPVAAPLIGGFVLAHGTWRDIFKVISVIIAISLVLVLFFIKESLPAAKRRTGSLLSAYAGIIEVARIRPMACAMVGFAALSALSLATTPRAESDYALDRPKP